MTTGNLYDGLSPQTPRQWAVALPLIVVGYYLILGIYRITFHPLARAGIPGPKLAAFTWLWEFYYEVCRNKLLSPILCHDALARRPVSNPKSR